MELTLVICAANFTNRFNDALQALPDLGVLAKSRERVVLSAGPGRPPLFGLAKFCRRVRNKPRAFLVMTDVGP